MRKKFIIGILIVLIIVVISLSTLALFTWTSPNTTLTLEVGEMTDVIFQEGNDIIANNIGPVLNYEDGEITEFAIINNAENEQQAKFYLDISEISDSLKEESFKYLLQTSTDGNNYETYKEGNFASATTGELVISDSEVLPSGRTYYRFIIYIDGNMENPISMMNNSLKATFNVGLLTASDITLAKLGLTANEGTPDFSQEATTDEGIYGAEDDYGTSYYFRGAVENNYVRFGTYASDVYYGFSSESIDPTDEKISHGYYNSLEECQSASSYNKLCQVGITSGTPIYWRIIRINGDGSIRMIYDGTRTHANGNESNDRIIGNSDYNDGEKFIIEPTRILLSNTDNSALGYMYGTINADSYEETTQNINDSLVKTQVDNWYQRHIANTGYNDKVADVIYCNDRSLYSGNGYGTNETYYGANDRMSSPPKPSLICPQQNDAFTVNDTTKGNGTLTYPVGLITVDEVSMAGASENYNTKYYLYNGENSSFWTMSPSYKPRVGEVYVGGARIDDIAYTSGTAIKPVISLKSSVELQGQGTMEDPFVVK